LLGKHFILLIYTAELYILKGHVCVYICVWVCVCMLVCSHLDGTPPIHHTRRLGRELNCPGGGVFPSLSLSISTYICHLCQDISTIGLYCVMVGCYLTSTGRTNKNARMTAVAFHP
jgi:hypothetical protein